ncbi:hypothetical protein C0Q70_12594 [Pomacea canaliculata]|uniref:Uncharacterized protein n=1 Tax=Pomacea canaliculata TaxID=400727 RepID=A0A2T7P1Y3_POMCA|nr:hypothetical protein C0Q70_12594 [Pomacea canaliculata]
MKRLWINSDSRCKSDVALVKISNGLQLKEVTERCGEDGYKRTATLHTRHCGQEWADLDAAGQRGHSAVQRAASCTTCKSRDTHSNTLVSSTFSFADSAVTVGYSVDGAADDGINTRDKWRLWDTCPPSSVAAMFETVRLRMAGSD